MWEEELYAFPPQNHMDSLTSLLWRMPKLQTGSTTRTKTKFHLLAKKFRKDTGKIKQKQRLRALTWIGSIHRKRTWEILFLKRKICCSFWRILNELSSSKFMFLTSALASVDNKLRAWYFFIWSLFCGYFLLMTKTSLEVWRLVFFNVF